jgi:hypothetical protein
MNEEYHETTRVAEGRNVAKRISWGAIIAGLSITLVTQITLSLLGMAIGAAVVDPMDRNSNGHGLAIGSGIWILLSSLISLFLGAMVASRLSGGPTKSDGILHGLVTWSVATLAMVILLATTAGAILGGAGTLLGGAMGLSAKGNGPQNDTLAAAKNEITRAFPEAGGLLPPTGRPSDRPSSQLTGLAKDDQQLAAAIARLEASGGVAPAPAQKEEVIQILVTKHSMAQPAAETLLNDWDQQFQQAKAKTEQKGREIGQVAAKGVSQGSFWAFAMLILGALVAALGGAVGARYWMRPVVAASTV